MFLSQIPKNELNAFKHYVSAFKKQNPETVSFDDGIYSYKTKRGVVKRFKSTKSKNATIRVNGFLFEPIE